MVGHVCDWLVSTKAKSNMQRSVLNRAAIEAADTTEVSGRVTADEVNLDRFHNRISKVCTSVAATLIPSSLRWMFLTFVLIVPQVLWGGANPSATPQTWCATVGAESSDKGRQALAFFPNEIWIHAGDSIKWTWVAHEGHTVTFVPDSEARPFFQTIYGSPDGSSFPNPKNPGAVVSTPGGDPDLGSVIPGMTPPPNAFGLGATFTVNFPTPGNYKQVCLFHANMTGVVHVLDLSTPLPHDQAFYDHQAAEQGRDLLSDRDGRAGAACDQCALKACVVAAGTGEITATAGGTSTLSVMRFLPQQINIRAGDTVEWTNQNPVEAHTVTFGTTPLGFPGTFAPFNAAPDPIGDGALLAVITSPADNVSSGIIAAAAQDQIGSQQTALGATRFRVKFPNAGSFPYYCLLHDDIGMRGIVLVFPNP
jgi:plastocyanin